MSILPISAFAVEGNDEQDEDKTNSNIIVSTESTTWKYLDDNTNPAGDNENQQIWATADFDDSSWKEAKGSFGAKNGAISSGAHDGYTANTLLTQYIPEGQENAGNDIPSYFFRTAFDLADSGSVKSLSGSILYDDAVRVYINGITPF